MRVASSRLALIVVTSACGVLSCGGSIGFGGAVGGSRGGVGVSTGGVGAGMGGFGMAIGVDEHRREIEKWHRERVERLKRDDGWLSLVGLFPLSDGRHRFGSAQDNDFVFPKGAPAFAGTIVVDGEAVRLEAAPGAGLTQEGEPVERVDLASDKSGDPTEIALGSIRFYVIDRPGTRYLRVKDASSPVRTEFTGIDRFAVDRAWRIAAHLTRYDPPKRLTVPNVAGFDETVDCPGILSFTLGDREYRLEPISESKEEMWLVFGDATNGHDTYGGGRFLYIPAADADGNTIIDFNKSYNPPCVFTPYATCPLPTRENVLPIRIEAGEKMWGESH